MGIISKLVLIRNRFLSLEQQALNAGVKLGANNYIASKFWSTEPYLISVGNHCQITSGVHLHTHGGGGEFC